MGVRAVDGDEYILRGGLGVGVFEAGVFVCGDDVSLESRDVFDVHTLFSVVFTRLFPWKDGVCDRENGGTNSGIAMVVECKAQNKSRTKVRLHDVREYERASCETISSQCERLDEE